MKELAVVEHVHDEVDKHLTLVLGVLDADLGRARRIHGDGLGRNHSEVVDHGLRERVLDRAVIVYRFNVTLAKYVLRLEGQAKKVENNQTEISSLFDS